MLVEALRYAAEPHGIYVYMTMSALWEGKFKCKRNCERRRPKKPSSRPPAPCRGPKPGCRPVVPWLRDQAAAAAPRLLLPCPGCCCRAQAAA